MGLAEVPSSCWPLSDSLYVVSVSATRMKKRTKKRIRRHNPYKIKLSPSYRQMPTMHRNWKQVSCRTPRTSSSFHLLPSLGSGRGSPGPGRTTVIGIEGGTIATDEDEYCMSCQLSDT